MRYIRHHSFNFNFVRRNFGDELYGLYRSWINLNYKHIRIYSRLKFLKYCMNFSLIPTHLSRFSERRLWLTDYKSKHNTNKLLHNTRNRLLNIEIYDLNRQSQKIRKEISILGKEVSNSLPVFIWQVIFDDNNRSFDNYEYKIWLDNEKKIRWLNKKKELETISNINNIKYKVYHDSTKNEFVYRFNDIDSNGDGVNINISPEKFIKNNMLTPLSQTNDKWFINLSNYSIPTDVTKLLQLGEGFSFPFFKNKKEMVIEFIKDFEGRGFRNNNTQKLKIRNTVVTQLQKFIHNNQGSESIQDELIRLLKTTKSYCKNNTNVIFTKADKGNVTVALDRAHYFDSINLMLNDETTYERIQKNPVRNLEQKLIIIKIIY